MARWKVRIVDWIKKLAWQPVASGLLVSLAFPPFHLSLIVFVALVPWLIYLSKATASQARRSGYCFGLVFWSGQLYFIFALADRWTGSFFVAAIPYVLGVAIASVYFLLTGWLIFHCFRSRILWAIPLAWAGVEVLRSFIILLAFPFGQLAAPLASSPALIQGAHFGTISFVSAWVCAINVLFAQFLLGHSYRQMRWLALSSLAILAGTLAWYGRPIEGSPHRVVAGQTGIDLAFGDQSDVKSRIARNVEAIEVKALGADLLVLPEGIATSSGSGPPLIDFAVTPRLPIVFGGQRGNSPTYQSAFGFDGKWSYADKTRLVIFGEYVPGRNWIPGLDNFKLPGGDLTPGDEVKSLDVGGFRVGAMLCFEGLFSDVAYKQALNGSNILAVMAIDDWYMGTNAPEQLRDASTWRAVETGLPVVRAASLGYTVIIDQRGRTIASTPLGKMAAIGADVRIGSEPILFRLLPFFPIASLFSLVIIPLTSWWRSRMRNSGEHAGSSQLT